jgi:hypothetical protein
LFAAYFLEAGLILIVAPWSSFWERNFFAETLPVVEGLLASPYARGAVSGVGVATLLAGLAELAGAFVSRRHTSSASPVPPEPPVPLDR